MSYAQNNNNDIEFKSSYATNWSTIQWNKAEKYVNKLQKRIYYAESKRDYNQIRNLQRLLVHSDSALLLTIKRVTQVNKGKTTPGIDGYRAITNEKRAELFDILKGKNIKKHNPLPASRTYISKKNSKLRSLGIPTIIDRIYQEILRMALEPQFEHRFEPISYGFRPKRGCHDAVKRIFYNTHSGKWYWVFEGDFKSCFDTLNHDFIMKQIKSFPFADVVEKYLKAGYVDNDVFHSTEEGTPQGGILSPLLANIALTGLEEYLNIKYIKNSNGDYVTKGNYRVVRYADDFVIFAQSKDEIEQVRTTIQPYLDERGLTLSEDKTRIVHLRKGFDFLGFNFRQYPTQGKFKIFIKPSKESIKKFKQKVDEIFRQCKGHNVELLIKRLNPLIRGTAYYWRPTVAKKIFSDRDYYIFGKVYKFLKHLHSNKGWKWIKNKYFPPYRKENRRANWVLTDPNKGITLYKMAWMPIRRRIMIKHNYSPYDKTKKAYFENREFRCYAFR